jgi:hypothetical protein
MATLFQFLEARFYTLLEESTAAHLGAPDVFTRDRTKTGRQP